MRKLMFMFLLLAGCKEESGKVPSYFDMKNTTNKPIHVENGSATVQTVRLPDIPPHEGMVCQWDCKANVETNK